MAQHVLIRNAARTLPLRRVFRMTEDEAWRWFRRARCNSRALDVDHKTAWVLSRKLRKAVAAERADLTLDGTVEMDGLYIDGHVRPANRRENRDDARRPCVLAFRQRQGRTLATVVPGGHRDPAWDPVRRPGKPVADEAPSCDELAGLFLMRRSNHGEACGVEPGASTNKAERFFTRVRRAAHGIHRRVAGRCLDGYIADPAFREDMRRRLGDGWGVKADRSGDSLQLRLESVCPGEQRLASARRFVALRQQNHDHEQGRGELQAALPRMPGITSPDRWTPLHDAVLTAALALPAR